MNQFLATVILVLLASVFTFFFAELQESMQEKITGKRDFSTKENAGYSVLTYSVIAVIVWLFILAAKLLIS